MSDLPEASAAPQPIAYAQVSTSGEMRWIVRFVGALCLCLLCADFLPLPYIWFKYPTSRAQIHDWGTIASLAGMVVAIIASIGMFHLRRLGILALAGLTLTYPVVQAVILPGALWQIVASHGTIAIGHGVLLLLLWRRAERHGVLVPPSPRAALTSPATDDLGWFLRLAGVFTLLPALSNTVNLTLNSGGLPYLLLPALSLLFIAARVALGVMLLRRRPDALLWLAALPFSSLVVFQFAQFMLIGFSMDYVLSALFMQLPEIVILSLFALVLHARVTRPS